MRQNIKTTVLGFYNMSQKNPHHRYKSWEHCYNYFDPKNPKFEKDTASLHLAFYLASWGMYRGSSFLLQRDYKFLTPIVPTLREYSDLRNESKIREDGIIEKTLELKGEIASYFRKIDYSDIKGGAKSEREASATLISKIILGTLGTVPAYDRYFVAGLKKSNVGITSSFGKKSLHELQQFVKANYDDLKSVQEKIKKTSNMKYPFMKIVDMYFWQIGSKEGLYIRQKN